MFVPASIGRRVLGEVIDYVVIMVIAVILSIIFGADWRFAIFLSFIDPELFNQGIYQISTAPTIIFAVMYFGYFIVFETVARTSVGKTLMGMTIVKEDGSPISFREALIRSLFRGADGAPVFYLMGIIAILLSPTRQRIGDHLAQAIVVDKAVAEKGK